MYQSLLVVHSIVRWLVVLTGVFACYRAISGLTAARAWTDVDKRAGLFFSIAIDVQLLIGLGLYFGLSPITRAAFANFAGAMHDRTLRFFAVEHVTLGVLAVVTVHVTSVLVKKTNGPAKHRRAAIGFVVTSLLILAAIPWPFLPYGLGRGWVHL